MDTDEHELLMLSHQHVSEFNVIPQDDKIIIAKTVWIYDAEDWVSRDRNKPYRDIKRGMLPPKVARIMVNLAIAGKTGVTVADPFCGTGTVLSEAIMVGCNVIGSDTNPDAIPGTKSNLEWLLSTPGLAPRTYNLAVADATHFDESFKSVDCIATEPYMGPLLDERNPSSFDKIKNIAKGLDKLYRGAFKAFHRALPVGGRVVMSIPVFHVYDREIQTISIDTLTSLGYNYVSAVPYSKPGAAVIRNITILEKK
jgi:tRNA G10  N-methylase Trm11